MLPTGGSCWHRPTSARAALACTVAEPTNDLGQMSSTLKQARRFSSRKQFQDSRGSSGLGPLRKAPCTDAACDLQGYTYCVDRAVVTVLLQRWDHFGCHCKNTAAVPFCPGNHGQTLFPRTWVFHQTPVQRRRQSTTRHPGRLDRHANSPTQHHLQTTTAHWSHVTSPPPSPHRTRNHFTFVPPLAPRLSTFQRFPLLSAGPCEWPRSSNGARVHLLRVHIGCSLRSPRTLDTLLLPVPRRSHGQAGRTEEVRPLPTNQPRSSGHPTTSRPSYHAQKIIKSLISDADDSLAIRDACQPVKPPSMVPLPNHHHTTQSRDTPIVRLTLSLHRRLSSAHSTFATSIGSAQCFASAHDAPWPTTLGLKIITKPKSGTGFSSQLLLNGSRFDN